MKFSNKNKSKDPQSIGEHISVLSPCFPRSLCHTDEAAFGNVKLIASRSNPHAAGADTDEARLALRVLGKEGHTQTFSNPLNWSSGGCGDSLCGLDQSLE